MSVRSAAVFIFLVCLTPAGWAQSEGDYCAWNNVEGNCRSISNCPLALEAVKRGYEPKICSFSEREPIVCCPNIDPNRRGSTSTTRRPALTTTTRRRTTTELYVPPVADYEYSDGPAECPQLPPNYTRIRAEGRKSVEMCIKYQEQYFPCVTSSGLSLSLSKSRDLECNHVAEDLIVNGENAKSREFPHMAMLGFGKNLNSISWGCGGTLISERFILTAGHCIYSREFGDVTYVRLGALKMSAPLDRSRVYRVEKIIKHPNYKSPGKYNDIALLKTVETIKLGKEVMPACLDIGARTNKAVATGWGATAYQGATADTLQKVVLQRFSDQECVSKFPAQRNMQQGLLPEIQLCYGHKTESKDTCQGDSGGPLQIYNTDLYCMYTVVGVTSFGQGCGTVNNPGVYTRVSAFLPWIESTVWP